MGDRVRDICDSQPCDRGITVAGKTKIAKQDSIARRTSAREALKLRRAGWHYGDIAEKLGMSQGGVYGIIQRELNEAIKEDAKEILQLDLERLDHLYSQLQSALDSGDLSVAANMLKVLERRSKYLGLDKQQPVQVDAHVSIVDLVRKAVEESERVELELVEETEKDE